MCPNMLQQTGELSLLAAVVLDEYAPFVGSPSIYQSRGPVPEQVERGLKIWKDKHDKKEMDFWCTDVEKCIKLAVSMDRVQPRAVKDKPDKSNKPDKSES